MKTTACYISIAWMIGSIPIATAAPPAVENIEVLRESADRGDADAMFRLGRAYLMGTGVKKDTQRAYELMSAAAEKGHADAMGGVGYFHNMGIFVPKDEEEAARWFRKGAEKDSAKSRLNLGKYLLKKSENAGPDTDTLRTEGLRWTRMAADQGLPEAAYSFGLIYSMGDHGQSPDLNLATNYLKLAADAGIPDAQNIMGSIHEGKHTPVDEELAKRYYRMAALQGHAKAQANLGRVLGPAVEDRETRVEAVAWLMIASSQNEITAVKLMRDVPAELKPGDLDEAKKRAALLQSQIVKPTR